MGGTERGGGGGQGETAGRGPGPRARPPAPRSLQPNSSLRSGQSLSSSQWKLAGMQVFVDTQRNLVGPQTSSGRLTAGNRAGWCGQRALPSGRTAPPPHQACLLMPGSPGCPASLGVPRITLSSCLQDNTGPLTRPRLCHHNTAHSVVEPSHPSNTIRLYPLKQSPPARQSRGSSHIQPPETHKIQGTAPGASTLGHRLLPGHFCLLERPLARACCSPDLAALHLSKGPRGAT